MKTAARARAMTRWTGEMVPWKLTRDFRHKATRSWLGSGCRRKNNKVGLDRYVNGGNGVGLSKVNNRGDVTGLACVCVGFSP